MSSNIFLQRLKNQFLRVQYTSNMLLSKMVSIMSLLESTPEYDFTSALDPWRLVNEHVLLRLHACSNKRSMMTVIRCHK